ncbi:glycosyltransferase family 4 protein [Streptomyces chiangmaiensis]|uniref:D-inositol 3-phosphate glycosyltransferase n=1 Tax=Streptomyces chiangmaiensis TaxID=766497 RepID=A0ABU7FCW0_9ACTN|nr:glycosyltransferase family 4 protein [Streptomyces chiangmaiensis]MED7821193.1 glycosyltransferase family 4 protein [Streptomyces chiangmaiensis]
MKITFLIHDIYGIGGTNRTTLNLAAALAGRHEVTIVSVRRHRTHPRFDIDPRVTVLPLVDVRKDSADLADPLLHERSLAFPVAEKRYHQYSRLTDHRVERYLGDAEADVITGTRAGINVYVARFAPPSALRIAQEHLTHDTHTKKLRTQLARQYRDLDALVTTTEADAAIYRAKMRLPGVRVLAVPNGVPDPGLPPADAGTRVVAAAGRLTRGKRFDLLIEAFAEVAAKHPDWTLRIYGAGPEKDRLQQLIDERSLGGRAVLMGVVSPIEAEFAKASIVASASDAESFGMTLVEAMRCGVPVVSTDCPLGPAEIIHDGVDGRLVPTGDRRALATALLDLIADEPARRRMGRAARRGALRYDPSRIVHTYEDLFADLDATRHSRASARHKSKWHGLAAHALRH